ncbi:unnamed protein product [Spirodela intermedia]|uniref:Uncharacterized protein n=1 Tax=Spirodela intermedia TaxID=51605 RepID=A0A7I8IJW0_SPIIN|nr:unnamed protein product [Spirodela intermedia]CAA6658128.1 unnamed protein product [Spirodela intermedia]
MAYNTTPVAAAATLLLLLIAAAAVAPASASTVTAYSRRGCTGKKITWRCGACYSFTGYKAGYFFDYSQGQIGRFYIGARCRGLYFPIFFDIRVCSPTYLTASA